MSQVPDNIGYGEGGDNLPEIKELLNGIARDLAVIRQNQIALLQKLDTDAGTESDYESTLTPDSLETEESNN